MGFNFRKAGPKAVVGVELGDRVEVGRTKCYDPPMRRFSDCCEGKVEVQGVGGWTLLLNLVCMIIWCGRSFCP